jgi:uncharacterized DUF497 family protein
MKFEWNEAKNRANLKKHGISFDEARLIFEGPTLSRVDDRFDYGETRYITVGLIRAIVAVVVVHTDRSGVTRIISARLASREERKDYYDHQRKAT